MKQKLLLDLLHQLWMCLKVGARVIAPLANSFAVEEKPGPTFLNDIQIRSQIDVSARGADAVPEKNVELALSERCGKFFFDHFAPGAIAARHRIFSRRDGLFDRPD